MVLSITQQYHLIEKLILESFTKMILFFDLQRNEICKILGILYIYITGLHLWQYIKKHIHDPT